MMNIINNLKNRWRAPGGYREVLKFAIPLILSTSSTTIQCFVDRMFLTWHSSEAIAAAVPGGLLSFTFMCLFMGTAVYVNTFVAQYYGAKQFSQIAPAVWQGIYFALISGILFVFFIPLAKPIFNLAGHEPAVKAMEIQYFEILCFGAPAIFISSAVSGFFTGRGETWTILWVNASATIVNIIIDYLLIFGSFGFPKLGIEGAAIATVVAVYFSAIMLICIMLRKKFRVKYKTLKSYKFNPSTLIPQISKPCFLNSFIKKRQQNQGFSAFRICADFNFISTISQES